MAEIYWRERDSEWTVLQPAPGTNSGFQEVGQYEFRCPAGTLYVDDEPLMVSPSGRAVWTPRFFAGEVTAEFAPVSGSRCVFLLDVSPDPGKLGRDVFATMVEELWAEDPRLVFGAEPSQTRIGAEGRVTDPWLAFARLRRYLPAFLAAIQQVRLNPRRTSRVARASVTPASVRRVDRTTATTLFRTSAVALLSDGPAAADIQSLRLNVPVTEETLDSAANRCLAALVRAVRRRAQHLSAQLESAVAQEKESETRTALSLRWPARRAQLTSFVTQLSAVLKSSPFNQITRVEMAAAGLTAISADPVYARAWGTGWRAIRDGVDGSPDLERMWVSPTWEIYERWCFVALRRWLVRNWPKWQWRSSSDGRSWKAKATIGEVQLRLQPAFRAGPAEGRVRWSVSRQRVPDIMLKVTGSAGVRFVLFDAKYRASRANVLAAMESAHIYQDSLRVGTVRPTGSLLLVPAAGGAPWLEGMEFQDLHRVGISILAPGNQIGLPGFIAELLGGAASRPTPSSLVEAQQIDLV